MKEAIEIRKTTEGDVPAVMMIFRQAIESLRVRGVDQWQNGYPNEDAIRRDIKNGISYVACLKVKRQELIVGTAAISFEPEPTYSSIYEGSWDSGEPYAVVHRIATAEEYKHCGVAAKLMEFARLSCRNNGVSWIRIDTHRDNLVMQKFLTKEGFVRRGSITLTDGSHRFGYDAETIDWAQKKEKED